VLAFLIPGAGHLYQKRTLKAGIFFVGILSLFFGGMILGNWQPVYSQVVSGPGPSVQMLPGDVQLRKSYSIGYTAQVLVGLPALPSLVQQLRFKADNGVEQSLTTEISSEFVGVFGSHDVFVPVTGTLTLKPDKLGAGTGTFSGVTRNGTAVSADIDEAPVNLGRSVFGSPRREISIAGLKNVRIERVNPDKLHGTVSRPFLIWYLATRDNGELDRLHGKLSQNYDIACVFTWIAGLLNLMAIWDAYDGPAYGYGDEEPEEEESPVEG